MAVIHQVAHFKADASVFKRKNHGAVAPRGQSPSWQPPGSRHDGAHHGMVSRRGVFGLNKSAVLARHGFHQGVAVTPHALQHHRYAYVKNKPQVFGYFNVHAIHLVRNVCHGDRKRRVDDSQKCPISVGSIRIVLRNRNPVSTVAVGLT